MCYTVMSVDTKLVSSFLVSSEGGRTLKLELAIPFTTLKKIEVKIVMVG